METKTIIYLVAAALVLRVVIRTIIRFLREGSEKAEGSESNENLEANNSNNSVGLTPQDKLNSELNDGEEE